MVAPSRSERRGHLGDGLDLAGFEVDPQDCGTRWEGAPRSGAEKVRACLGARTIVRWPSRGSQGSWPKGGRGLLLRLAREGLCRRRRSACHRVRILPNRCRRPMARRPSTSPSAPATHCAKTHSLLWQHCHRAAGERRARGTWSPRPGIRYLVERVDVHTARHDVRRGCLAAASARRRFIGRRDAKLRPSAQCERTTLSSSHTFTRRHCVCAVQKEKRKVI